MGRGAGLYPGRGVEYPFDFAIYSTRLAMRQSPQLAMEQLAAWADRRYSLGWTADQIKALPPAKIREQLIEASRGFVESGELEKAIDAALACRTDDELNEHIESGFGVKPGVPHWMRDLRDEDREQAVRGRIEGILRAELLQLEQTVLLDTLDTTWKDHLYEMDQLRDAISFRAFSQEDPRIAFQREGSRLFKQLMQTIRDRVTDTVVKATLVTRPPGAPPARPAHLPSFRSASPRWMPWSSGPLIMPASHPMPTGPPPPRTSARDVIRSLP